MANWHWFGRLHLRIFRLTGGRLGARLAGIDMVMVDTIGRKSGQVRTIPIACYPYENDITVVASNNGSHKDPIWWLNLQAQPNVQLQLGRKRYQALAEKLNEDERDSFWPNIVAINSAQISHQKHSSRKLPVVRFRLLKQL